MARLEAGEALRYCEDCGHASALLVCCEAITARYPYTAHELRVELAADELREHLGLATGRPC